MIRVEPFKVILRLQESSRIQKALSTHKPPPPKKGQQGRTAPTFNLGRHTDLVS